MIKHTKRISAALVAMLMLVMSCTFTFAVSSNPKVVDKEGSIYSESEVSALSVEYDRVSEEIGWDVVMYIGSLNADEDEIDEKYDNVYRTEGYAEDGIMFVVDTESMMATVVTKGDAYNRISNDDCYSIIETMIGYFNDEDGMSAATKFLDIAKEYSTHDRVPHAVGETSPVELTTEPSTYADIFADPDGYSSDYETKSITDNIDTTTLHHVNDEGNLIFDDAQIKTLTEKYDKASKDTGWDVVLVVGTLGAPKSTIQSQYRQVYKECGFSKDGIMFVIDAVSNARVIVTEGKAYKAIDDELADDMADELLVYLNKGDNYGAANKFAEQVEYYNPGNFLNRIIRTFWDYGIFIFGVALIVCLVIFFSIKKGYTDNGKSGLYDLHQNSTVNITQAEDEFIDKTISVTVVQSSSSSRSGGGGGGGRSGGGSRGF